MCHDHELPILTSQMGDAARGINPNAIGQGVFGRAYLNEEEGLVVKELFDMTRVPTLLTEAKALMLFKDIPCV